LKLKTTFAIRIAGSVPPEMLAFDRRTMVSAEPTLAMPVPCVSVTDTADDGERVRRDRVDAHDFAGEVVPDEVVRLEVRAGTRSDRERGSAFVNDAAATVIGGMSSVSGHSIFVAFAFRVPKSGASAS
jgi:hypothetical protein